MTARQANLKRIDGRCKQVEVIDKPHRADYFPSMSSRAPRRRDCIVESPTIFFLGCPSYK